MSNKVDIIMFNLSREIFCADEKIILFDKVPYMNGHIPPTKTEMLNMVCQINRKEKAWRIKGEK